MFCMNNNIYFHFLLHTMSTDQDEFEGLELLSDSEKDFIKLHGQQLLNAGFPITRENISKLYEKLHAQKFDAGDFFRIMEDENDNCYRLQAIKDIGKDSEFFLVDHFFSFRYTELREKIESKPELRKRLNKILKFWKKKETTRDLKVIPESINDPSLHPCFDDEDIEDPRNLDIDWDNVITLSLYGCKISNPDFVAEMITKLPKLKALWVNNNPCVEDDKYEKMLRIYVENHHSTIEIFNSKFTIHTSEWGLKFATFGGNLRMVEESKLEDITALDISGREFNNIGDPTPLNNMPKCTKIYAYNTYFEDYKDANTFMNMIKGMSNLTHLELDYYMLDLFWKITDRILFVNPSIKYINGYDIGFSQPKEEDEEIDKIIKDIWKVTESYKIAQGNMQDLSPIFYVPDEVGCAIVHSIDEANLVNIPFIHYVDNKLDSKLLTYNIFWPKSDLKEGDFVFADKISILPENQQLQRTCIFESIDIEEVNAAHESMLILNREARQRGQAIIDAELQRESSKLSAIPIEGRKIKISSDYKLLIENLNDDRFEVVATPQEADILWVIENFKSLVDADPSLEGKYVNQLPFETCLVNKKFLALTIKELYGIPEWLPKSIDSKREFKEFLGEYLHKKTYAAKNFWIAKPTNLARSMNMVISDNLDNLIRVAETGPYIFSEYVDAPLRYKGAKFEMRFYVMVRSIEPLEIYIHDLFFVNVSKNDFTLDKRRLFQYDTHFTYNHRSTTPGIYIPCEKFKSTFEQEFKVPYNDILEKVKSLIRTTLILSKTKYPGMASKNAVGFYGIDILLTSDFIPKLLEFTFSPDCSRATKTDPHFFSTVLGCLFLGLEDGVSRVI